MSQNTKDGIDLMFGIASLEQRDRVRIASTERQRARFNPAYRGQATALIILASVPLTLLVYVLVWVVTN